MHSPCAGRNRDTLRHPVVICGHIFKGAYNLARRAESTRSRNSDDRLDVLVGYARPAWKVQSVHTLRWRFSRYSYMVDCASEGEEAVSATALQRWICGELGRGWTLDATRQLPGRRAGKVYFVDARSPYGKRHRLVLKLFPPDEPDAVNTESCGIQIASGAGVPVPDILARDNGIALGTGCILMTRLVGRPIVRPRTGWTWLVAQLAEILLAIHSADAASAVLGTYEPHAVGEPTRRPSKHWPHTMWQRCTQVFQSRPPDDPVGFLHRDYHPGNVVWSSSKLSGVVDWSAACIGSPWADVAHCRFNLWRWHGAEAADAFVTKYWKLRPDLPPYHPYWDIATAMSIPWPIREIVLRSAVDRLASTNEPRPPTL